MKCPKCSGIMHPALSDKVTALVCDQCHGFWIKDDDYEKIAEDKVLLSFDSDQNIDKSFDEIRDIRCPEPQCNEIMMKMTDREQLHIKYEMCQNCRGVFLDAGELEDKADFNMMERVTQVLSTLRSNLS